MSDENEELDVGLDRPETPDVTAGRAKIAEAGEYETESDDDPMIAALLREREGYKTFDKPDRVKAVDAELRRRGYKKGSSPQTEAPKRRGRPRKTTATAPAKPKG